MLSRKLETVNQEAVAGIPGPDLAAFMSVAARMQVNLGQYG